MKDKGGRGRNKGSTMGVGLGVRRRPECGGEPRYGFARRVGDADERMGGANSMGDAPCNKESSVIDGVKEARTRGEEDAKLGALGGGANAPGDDDTSLGETDRPVKGDAIKPGGGGWRLSAGGTDNASRQRINGDGAHGGWQSAGHVSGPLGSARRLMGVSDLSLDGVHVAFGDSRDVEVIREASGPDGTCEGNGYQAIDASGGLGDASEGSKIFH
ncbi:unnamed protein product [Ilex paraguariensis]|uniref:Uncharacterized protein n=1 Tax=Ilex paraguariensis TaxID=185542 RepID=A0ABC8QNM2_9AQUA